MATNWGEQLPIHFTGENEWNVPRVWIYTCVYWQIVGYLERLLEISPIETGNKK